MTLAYQLRHMQRVSQSLHMPFRKLKLEPHHYSFSIQINLKVP
jgi:hypothetical protein